MVQYKTSDPIAYINKLFMLYPFRDYGITWQSYFDGIIFTIEVDE